MIKNIVLSSLLLGSVLPATNISTNSNNNVNVQDAFDQEDEACTFMYVGKNISKTGNAIVARSADAGPIGMNLNCRIFKHNELSNVTTKSKTGFTWTFPKTTYRYISTPRNPKVNKGLHWEASAINEKGVCVSATLSCDGNPVVVNQTDGIDKFVSTGIGEDNLAQIVGATAATARQGIETVASIIDEQGADGDNAIMVMDKNETWYMEIYSGHQYVAIKMPDDKACTIGNEFMLDSLGELGINETNRDEMCIISPNLKTLADENGFAVYKSESETIYNLDLFKTYAAPLLGGEQSVYTDNSHRRTWRGINLFGNDEDKETYKTYQTTYKYPSFFAPNEGDKLGISDVIAFMRDKFENITSDELNPNHDSFVEDEANGKLRYVAADSAYQIHVLTINPQLPDETCVEEWLCLSNSYCSPFIPLSNGINKMNNYYIHQSEEFGYDPLSAECIYQKLNGLAFLDRKHIAIPIKELWTEYENIWNEQYHDVVNQIQNKSTKYQKDILTNFCLHLQNMGLDMSSNIFDDLIWHIVNNYYPTASDESLFFHPLVNLQEYVSSYGWDYQRNDKDVTLTHDDKTVTINLEYTGTSPNGQISDGITSEPISVRLKNDVPFVDYATIHSFCGHEDVAEINIKDYKSHNSTNVTTIVVAVTVPVAVAAIAIPVSVILYKKKVTKRK